MESNVDKTLEEQAKRRRVSGDCSFKGEAEEGPAANSQVAQQPPPRVHTRLPPSGNRRDAFHNPVCSNICRRHLESEAVTYSKPTFSHRRSDTDAQPSLKSPGPPGSTAGKPHHNNSVFRCLF